MLDLLVVGGGPAGLACAIGAALAGLDTAVLEPRAAPVDKACGEGLMPGAVHALRALGVTPPGQPLHGIRYLDGRHTVTADFPAAAGPGLGVRRTALHSALAARAAALGVPVLPRAAGPVTQHGDRVTAAGLTARHLAAADGLHSPVRRALGLHRPAPAPARYGLRRHYAVAPWSDHVEVHWSADAEAYVTPVGPGLVGVAVLTTRRAPYDDHLARFPDLARRLAGRRAGPVRGAGPLRQTARRRTAGRVLLVGDAAGYVDALTGEGVAVALAGAAALVECVSRGRPEEYEAAWLRASRRYRLLTAALLWARHRPGLAPRIVPAAARWPGAFTRAVAALA
ncbi:NAD(P)/FAD-dependent oxidoreductase [Streptomyces capparidis]